MAATPLALESELRVRAPARAPAWLRALKHFGPGVLVAVGYIDPGNWSTDLAAGSRTGYALLSVVVLASLMAMLLQALSARLGVATGQDLAQLSRRAYPRLAVPLWLVAELAMVATDLAEVLGSAIALELLFGIPLRWGVLVTCADVLVVLALAQRRPRVLELLVLALLAGVAGCFAYELVLAGPSWPSVARGLAPSLGRDPELLYLALGIVGATVMPHNLYLHSSLARQKAERSESPPREAVRWAELDAGVSLGLSMLVNAAILVLAGAVFHRAGAEVAGLADAQRLIAPLLGSAAAATLFAVALLAAGQTASFAGTLAGEVVMSGFLELRVPPWARRLATRGLALIPALAVIHLVGERGVGPLLVGSQVVLSLQLPFAMIPLLFFCGDRGRMGELASPRWMRLAGWGSAAVILGLNAGLLVLLVHGVPGLG